MRFANCPIFRKIMKSNQNDSAILLVVLSIAAIGFIGAGVWVWQTQIASEPAGLSRSAEPQQNPDNRSQAQEEKEKEAKTEAELEAEGQSPAGESKSQNAGTDFGLENDKCAVFARPFDKPEGGDKFDFPLNCYFDIGSDFLNWNFKVPEENEKNVVLEISDSAGKPIQNITVEDETIGTLFFLDGDINIAEDINFDGYKDLRIVNVRGANIGGYNYWIFNPELKKFEKNPVLANIPYPSFDRTKRTITAFHAANSGDYSAVFKFIDGKYQMVESKTTPINDLAP